MGCEKGEGRPAAAGQRQSRSSNQKLVEGVGSVWGAAWGGEQGMGTVAVPGNEAEEGGVGREQRNGQRGRQEGKRKNEEELQKEKGPRRGLEFFWYLS